MKRTVLWLMVTLACGASTIEAKVTSRTVTYECKGVALEGYVAWDDAVEGLRPGVLIIHQWMGLSNNERMRADMLAELGYIAFAGDVYGKGVRPKNTKEASQQAGALHGDPTLFRARLTAGLEELRLQPLVDRNRIAAIGYCFGGGGVLELARSGAELAGGAQVLSIPCYPAPALTT